jgi:hypothetical protein
MRLNQLPAVPALATALLLAPAAPAATQYLYADASAAVGGDGANWCTAYRSLAAALDEAALIVVTTGDDVVVRVAQGLYRPDRGPGRVLGDQTLSFEIQNKVSILGGYEGGCLGGLTRDIDLYPTILSGDIGTLGDASDNSYRVVYADYVGPGSSIDGVTIKDGQGDGSVTAVTDTGAALRLEYSSLTISRCRFTGNAVGLSGGAVFAWDTDLTMTDCIFEQNEADFLGGAVTSQGGGSLTLSGCTFSDNTGYQGGALSVSGVELSIIDSAFSGNEGAMGGAIYTSGEETTEIRGCNFSSNTASIRGGAIELGQTGDSYLVSSTFDANETEGSGGAIFKYDYSYAARIWLSTCHFVDNVAASAGGAIYNIDDISLSNSVFEGNSANWAGGAIAQGGQDPWFSQLTMYGNSAPSGDAIYLFNTAQVTIANSIIYDNGSDPLAVDATSEFWAQFSDLEGCGGSGTSWAWSHVTDDGDNIDEDPQFVSATFPFDLAPTSPCIDTGDNGWVPYDFGDLDDDGDEIEDLPWDIEGDDRVIGSAVEMGANEYAGPTGTPGDADGDGDADFGDMLAIIAQWGPGGGPADLNGDGSVGFADMLIVLQYWS